MNDHPCDIYKVARQCGVILRDTAEHSPTSRRPRECYTKETLRDIGRHHGERHLALVLRLIVESGNAGELYASTIQAISGVILSGQIEITGSTFEALDRIDLGILRAWARNAIGPGTAPKAMTAALLVMLQGPSTFDKKAA